VINLESYKYGVDGKLSKGEKLLLEFDNEEIAKYGHRLERNFKIGEASTLRDGRIYSLNVESQLELKRLSDTNEDIYITAVNFNADKSICSYDIVTKDNKLFYGFYPSEFNLI